MDMDRMKIRALSPDQDISHSSVDGNIFPPVQPGQTGGKVVLLGCSSFMKYAADRNVLSNVHGRKSHVVRSLESIHPIDIRSRSAPNPEKAGTSSRVRVSQWTSTAIHRLSAIMWHYSMLPTLERNFTRSATRPVLFEASIGI
ncbi:hypothetical protein M8818_002405 [Zalaria obscura]|uniref:Uncharacterized protein n=1 Tax=Zalaria obscura TaxID=2024903 RepID=A0ACC3SHP7_9PEZI